jgi:ABC-type uncharacterized transport system fused permease/ATPase subunit
MLSLVVDFLAKYVGVVAATIIVLVVNLAIFQYIWNTVLYERIEGVDTITFWDALGMYIIIQTVRAMVEIPAH